MPDEVDIHSLPSVKRQNEGDRDKKKTADTLDFWRVPEIIPLRVERPPDRFHR